MVDLQHDFASNKSCRGRTSDNLMDIVHGMFVNVIKAPGNMQALFSCADGTSGLNANNKSKVVLVMAKEIPILMRGIFQKNYKETLRQVKAHPDIFELWWISLDSVE